MNNLLNILLYTHGNIPASQTINLKSGDVYYFDTKCTDDFRNALSDLNLDSISTIEFKFDYVIRLKNFYDALDYLKDKIRDLFNIKTKNIKQYICLDESYNSYRTYLSFKQKENSLLSYTVTVTLSDFKKFNNHEIIISMFHHILRSFSLANNSNAILKDTDDIINSNLENYYNNIKLIDFSRLASLTKTIKTDLSGTKPSNLRGITNVFYVLESHNNLKILDKLCAIFNGSPVIYFKNHRYKLSFVPLGINLYSANQEYNYIFIRYSEYFFITNLYKEILKGEE